MEELRAEFRILLNSVKNYVALEKSFGIKNISLNNSLSPEDKQKELNHLKKLTANCTNCSLYKSKRNLVFGEGSPKAKLVFVGEAPGLEEDLQGLPFVGRAGQLLTKIIEAMGLTRAEVYICNVLKCRPPNNRSPLPEEIAQCRQTLWKQLKLIEPKVICALGKFAAQSLLDSQEPISNLRGKFFEIQGIKIMPTYHPAYLLRNPNDKKIVWEDIKKVRDYLKDNP
jgi:DNA polymerase